MDAVKMLNEVVRMSQNCAIRCEECPISSNCNGMDVECNNLRIYHPEKYVEIVENWSKAHPQKTQADLLLERYPNAIKDSKNIPVVCPKCLGEKAGCKTDESLMVDCALCRKKYWSAPVEG
ncbi:hypothetical protein [Pygmaiobacter massiliensis]|uniref:hypothetical protein n=1 Tax=Pygmaiobacter massiliensis TaxID=1917873 RepID=UPI000C7C8A45|nr:hypothetical protein [Pygmaiobacter massiliensis]